MKCILDHMGEHTFKLLGGERHESQPALYKLNEEEILQQPRKSTCARFVFCTFCTEMRKKLREKHNIFSL